MERGASDSEVLYRQRLHRYVTAMHNRKADRVPVRPFLAEFCASYAGYDCMQVTHDPELAFEAVRRVGRDFDCDALVGNMVYVWTGLTQALGLRYYGIPGIHCPADRGFQYLEPPEDQSWMRADEYDHLIEDPTGYLYSVWYPRVTGAEGLAAGADAYRRQVALVKGAMAMWNYFLSFGRQARLMREECGMPGAIAGILKAPMDILADKLRGYLGLVEDLHERPEKVLAACRALAPHLLHVARSGADPAKQVPIGFWMHRSCVPFITPSHFAEIHWPTLKPIIENLWAAGHQTLFYAEGKWGAHLDAFAELPEQSIVFHIDRDDPFAVHRALGRKFCLSGGVPNTLLAFNTPEEVSARVRALIEGLAGDGGYIVDASAIVQNDAKVENVRAMVETARAVGNYGGAPCEENLPGPQPAPDFRPADLRPWHTGRAPGVCIPWADELARLPPIQARPALAQRVWEDVEQFGYTFIWHCLESF